VVVGQQRAGRAATHQAVRSESQNRWLVTGLRGGASAWAAVDAVDHDRSCPDRSAWPRPAGTGQWPMDAVPPSSAPPTRPSRTPEPAKTRTPTRAPRELIQTYDAGPDRVHHDEQPSRPGVVPVSVSLRHQRSSVTFHRPPAASRRMATGRTRSPFCTTATGCRPAQDR
jgi:hypothetical protein